MLTLVLPHWCSGFCLGETSEALLCRCTWVFLSLKWLCQPGICFLLPLMSDISGTTTDLLLTHWLGQGADPIRGKPVGDFAVILK